LLALAQTFEMVFAQYIRHPESKSLAPDGAVCQAETTGLLKRAHVVAGDIRYVGKETDRKWEKGEDMSVLEFAATEYRRTGKVPASDEVKTQIKQIGINKCALESGFDRKNSVRKLVRGLPVKQISYTAFIHWLREYTQRNLSFANCVNKSGGRTREVVPAVNLNGILEPHRSYDCRKRICR
jgi:hypothetical protein